MLLGRAVRFLQDRQVKLQPEYAQRLLTQDCAYMAYSAPTQSDSRSGKPYFEHNQAPSARNAGDPNTGDRNS